MKNTSITFIYSLILLVAAVLLIWNYIAGKRSTQKQIEKTTVEKKVVPAPQKPANQPSGQK